MVRKLTITDIYRGKAVVPELRLCGKWLKEAGYEKGQKVELVQNEDGSILIKKV